MSKRGFKLIKDTSNHDRMPKPDFPSLISFPVSRPLSVDTWSHHGPVPGPGRGRHLNKAGTRPTEMDMAGVTSPVCAATGAHSVHVAADWH
jgi:hypothetical protein